MSPREKYIAIIANDKLRKADAIIILEGDLLVRIPEGARLYKDGWAPLVVISGGDVQKLDYALPASQMLPALMKEGVPEEAIILEEKSQHTREQALELLKLVEQRGWKSIIIVASHYHQYRAYLTFLKAILESGSELIIINAPMRQVGWFEKNARGRRVDLLEEEFKKIDEYAKKGHVATFEEAISYQEWKESRP